MEAAEKIIALLDKGGAGAVIALLVLAIGFLVKMTKDQKDEIVAERKANKEKDQKVLDVINEYHEGTTDVVRAMNSIEKILAEMRGQMLATIQQRRE